MIDGATDTVLTTLSIGGNPKDLAINPVTNRIYVLDQTAGTVVVIDGATDSIIDTVTIPDYPFALAVNPVTNKIYVADENCGGTCGPAEVTVIDGATHTTTTITDSNSIEARAVAVNPFTNKIYVTGNGNGGLVTVIDGDSNSTSDVTVSATTDVLAVNPASNKIYVGSVGGTVIDGPTNTPSGTASFTSPVAVVVNPVTGKAYMVDNGNDSVTVIAEQNVNSIPLKANIVPIANNISATLTPTTGFSATSTFSPTSPAPTGLFFQADTWQGTWTQAQSSHGNFVGQTPTLQPGFHILYAFATDGQDATSVNTGRQSAPLVSNIAAYGFLVF